MTMKQDTVTEQVTTTDGATIAFARQGSGDPLLLVHGGPTSGEAWALVATHLQSRFTVVTMDRRGRGASTDGAEYSLDLEAADVAAVVDAIGGAVHVVGHSSGATVALLAPARSTGVRSLVLYEPVLAPQHFPEGLVDRVEELVRTGDSAAAADAWWSGMCRIGLFTPEEVESLKGNQPVWERSVAAMPVVPREHRTLAAAPVDLDAVSRISVPVLLLVGELTTSPLVLERLDALERALPDVRRATIPGQRHLANGFAPEALAGLIASFLHSTSALGAGEPSVGA